jgi:hypothetical protein
VISIPEAMCWWEREPGGAEWLARLPGLAAECAEQWALRLGPPFEPAHISLVVPAERADGTPAVLKVNFPEPESEHEAAALEHWTATARSGCSSTTRSGGRCWSSAASRAHSSGASRTTRRRP